MDILAIAEAAERLVRRRVLNILNFERFKGAVDGMDETLVRL